MIRRRREDERTIGLKDEGRKDGGGREDEGQKMKDEERRK